jgi:gas vesicle protein
VEKIISKVSYLLVGLGIGSLVGILFAPKSGEETREYLVQKAREGSEYSQKKVRELKERAEDVVQHGKEVVTEKKGQITTAIDAGREASGRRNRWRRVPEGNRRWRSTLQRDCAGIPAPQSVTVRVANTSH